MSDTAFENACKRKDAINQRLSDIHRERSGLESELKRIDSFLETWREFAAPAYAEYLRPSLMAGQFKIESGIPIPPRGGSHNNPPKESVGKAAKEAIIERQAPIQRQELLKEIKKRGIVLNGKDPAMVLSTMMWRMKDQFVRIKGHGYWLADIPYEAANYIPGQNKSDNPEEDEQERKFLHVLG